MKVQSIPNHNVNFVKRLDPKTRAACLIGVGATAGLAVGLVIPEYDYYDANSEAPLPKAQKEALVAIPFDNSYNPFKEAQDGEVTFKILNKDTFQYTNKSSNVLIKKDRDKNNIFVNGELNGSEINARIHDNDDIKVALMVVIASMLGLTELLTVYATKKREDKQSEILRNREETITYIFGPR